MVSNTTARTKRGTRMQRARSSCHHPIVCVHSGSGAHGRIERGGSWKEAIAGRQNILGDAELVKTTYLDELEGRFVIQ